MCPRPDNVSDLSALTELSAGGRRTSVSGIYSPGVLQRSVMSSSGQFGIDGDCGVGGKTTCEAAAGAHGGRGPSGERRGREPVCKRRHCVKNFLSLAGLLK